MACSSKKLTSLCKNTACGLLGASFMHAAYRNILQLYFGTCLEIAVSGACLKACIFGFRNWKNLFYLCLYCSLVQLKGCGSVSVNQEWQDLDPGNLTPPKVVDAFIHQTIEQFSRRTMSFSIPNQDRRTVIVGKLIERLQSGKTLATPLANIMLMFCKELVSTVRFCGHPCFVYMTLD